jgi:hypothetical protein
LCFVLHSVVLVLVVFYHILTCRTARCSTPWRASVASCAFGLGFLVERMTVLSAALEERFVFYVPPALSAIQPSQGSAAGGVVLTIVGRGFDAPAHAAEGGLITPSDVARCRLLLTCTAPSGPVQVALTSAATPASGGGGASSSSPPSQVTCHLPPAPCAGSAIVSFARNGVDFVHHLADCPDVDGRRAPAVGNSNSSRRQERDGCIFEFVGEAGAPLPPAPSAAAADALVDTGVHPVEGGGLSAGGAVAVVVGILAYVYLARCVTLLAERRRFVRQDNGSSVPYSLGEAYVLWLLFGTLGAHR